MAENKKVEKKEVKSTNLKNKKNLLIIGAAVVIIIIGILVAVLGNDKDPEGGKPSKETQINSTEETVEDEYGFSKEDAINVIKGIFNSDSYQYEATVREDNMYIVTVTNPDSDTKYAYVVDPNDGSFYEIAED